MNNSVAAMPQAADEVASDDVMVEQGWIQVVVSREINVATTTEVLYGKIVAIIMPMFMLGGHHRLNPCLYETWVHHVDELYEQSDS